MVISVHGDGVTLELKVRAGSKRNGVRLMAEWVRVDVQQPALEGRANAAVVAVLEAYFGCKVSLLRGERDPRKVVLLHGVNVPLVAARLAQSE